jgi:hypothetical protein
MVAKKIEGRFALQVEITKLKNLSPAQTQTIHLAGFSYWVDADAFAGFTKALKGNHTINGCKQCIITAAPNVVTGVEFGSALPNQDIARPHNLPTIALDAQTLSI